MSGIQKRIATMAAAMAFAFGCLCALPAFAQAQPHVTGADYLTTQESAAGPGYIDVLSVQGKEGDQIYVNVDHNGDAIASHLLYTLTNDSATAASDGTLAGVMSLQIPDYQADDAYVVTVFSDYDETDELYQGTTTGVFAQLGDTGTANLIGVRTIGSEQRAFNAPARFEADGITYDLASADPVSTSPLTYAYKEAAGTPAAIDGSITYVDDAGNVLDTQAIPGLQKGAKATEATILHAVKHVDDSGTATWWMPVNFAHTVQASYPGTTDFVVPCKKLDLTETDVNGSPFVAQITYRAGDTVLLTDEVPVSKLYQYAPPSTLTLGPGATAKSYKLSGTQDARFDTAAGTLKLDPKAENAANDDNPTVSIDINYDEQANTQIYYVKMWLCPTSSDQALPAQPFATATFEAKDGEAPQTFDPLHNAYIDSSAYDLAPGMQTAPYTFSYGSNAHTVTNVYYVPKGQKPAANPYTITIQYRNAADRSLIESHTYTVSPNDLKDTVYTAPERFTSGSTTYVRLKGQEAGIQHGYYTMFRTYTVWYRDINNSLLADVVVNPLTYATVDNGTTTRNGAGTATGAAGAGTGATGTAGDGTTIGLGAGTGQNVLAGADGQGDAALNGEGQDANSERIGDNETPLAADAGANGQAGDETASPWWTNPAAIAGLVGACLVAALLLFLLMRRRKQQKEGDAAQQ